LCTGFVLAETNRHNPKTIGIMVSQARLRSKGRWVHSTVSHSMLSEQRRRHWRKGRGGLGPLGELWRLLGTGDWGRPVPARTSQQLYAGNTPERIPSVSTYSHLFFGLRQLAAVGVGEMILWEHETDKREVGPPPVDFKDPLQTPVEFQGPC
jgi:hypothetical protein